MNILFAAINFALIVWASLSIADHYGDAIGASVAIGLSALNAIRYNLEAIRSRHD